MSLWQTRPLSADARAFEITTLKQKSFLPFLHFGEREDHPRVFAHSRQDFGLFSCLNVNYRDFRLIAIQKVKILPSTLIASDRLWLESLPQSRYATLGPVC